MTDIIHPDLQALDDEEARCEHQVDQLLFGACILAVIGAICLSFILSWVVQEQMPQRACQVEVRR